MPQELGNTFAAAKDMPNTPGNILAAAKDVPVQFAGLLLHVEMRLKGNDTNGLRA